MGEQSYFQRKFLPSKFKRAKVVGEVVDVPCGSGGSPQSVEQDRYSKINECDLLDTDITSTNRGEAPEIRSSESRRQSASQAADSTRALHCDEAGPSRLANDQGEAVAEAHTAEATTSNPEERILTDSRQPNKPWQTSPTPDDHIETLNFHPEPTQGHESNDAQRTRSVPKQSRLSKATRAILLFRRATSSMTNVGNNNNNNCQQKSFVASLWSRQNTADNSTCTRSSRMDSLASSNNNRSHHSLTAFLSGGGGSSVAAAAVGDQSSLRDGASLSSSFSLPRFIVPKLNTLKLPIVCLIKSLDNELMREIFIHRYELGQYLIDNLKVSLGMKDEKYFGLKMADSLEEQEDVRKPWLDLNESVYKQISKHGRLVPVVDDGTGVSSATKSVSFYLRIKFYPPNLARVQDQFLRHYLWLQLRRDLRLGKLTSSMNNLTYLMACVLQYELGDHSSELVAQRLPGMTILPNQDLIEQKAIDIWQQRLAGAQRHLVLMQFLRASVILETYGFDYYPVRDHQRQRAFLLGFNYAGVKTIRNGRIVNHFRWHNLSKISYERRMIIFHIYPNENSKRKQILGFKCLSNDECQNLYLRLLEQKYFFTVDLAYFDKSVRHPSHLQPAETPFSTNNRQNASEQPLAQLNEWDSGEQSSDGLPNGYFSENHADLAEEQQHGEDGQTGEPSPCEQRIPSGPEATRRPTETLDELSVRRMNFQHRKQPVDTVGGKATTITCSGSTPDSSLEWHPSRQWQSATATAATSAHVPHATSGSYQQVAGGFRNAPTKLVDSMFHEQASHLHQLDSTGMAHEFTCCAAAASDNSRNAFSSTQSPTYDCYSSAVPVLPSNGFSSMAGSASIPHHCHGTQQAQLCRQCSSAKLSPECESAQSIARFDPSNLGEEQHSTGLNVNFKQEAQRYEEATRTTTNYSSASQRLANWTEQFLVQPAALFSQSDGWSSWNQPRQQQAAPTSEMLMQVFRFCTFILLLSFLVRLSDGLSNTLIDMLSFETSSGTKLTSVLDGASGG